jgi:hypothetical protein
MFGKIAADALGLSDLGKVIAQKLPSFCRVGIAHPTGRSLKFFQ